MCELTDRAERRIDDEARPHPRRNSSDASPWTRKIFGGKPIIRGRRLAVEHVLGMLAAGDARSTILMGYPWLEAEDIQACLVYARRLVGHERVDPALGGSAA